MDGFYDKGKKFLSSIFKSLFIVVAGYAIGKWWGILYLALIWWVLFDPIYNLVRGLPLFYVGNTKWTDKLIIRIFHENSPHISFITKLMALATTVALWIRS